MLLNHCLLLLTHICFVRGTFRWKLKGGDLKVGEHPVHQNILELQSALKLADKDLYLNIHTIFKLLVVLTVTSVCCKRSFSTLHRLKTRVRSTMRGVRLCGWAKLHSHRNMAVNRKNILRRYDVFGDWKIGRFFMDN